MLKYIYLTNLQVFELTNVPTTAHCGGYTVSLACSQFLVGFTSVSYSFISTKLYDKRDDFDFDIVNLGETIHLQNQCRWPLLATVKLTDLSQAY